MVCAGVTQLLLNYTKDGQPFFNLLCIIPVFSPHGELTYFVGTYLSPYLPQSPLTFLMSCVGGQTNITGALTASSGLMLPSAAPGSTAPDVEDDLSDVFSHASLSSDLPKFSTSRCAYRDGGNHTHSNPFFCSTLIPHSTLKLFPPSTVPLTSFLNSAVSSFSFPPAVPGVRIKSRRSTPSKGDLLTSSSDVPGTPMYRRKDEVRCKIRRPARNEGQDSVSEPSQIAIRRGQTNLQPE